MESALRGRRAQTGLALVILAAACWLVLFNRLDAAPMRLVDEVRVADNAIEMVETRNLLVTRFDREPETWNTKPPLQVWLQALDVKLLGIQTLAFRLPSALAALATVLTLFLFARREFGDVWSALLTALLLLSSTTYVLVHCARSAEYDAMLVLWLLASALAFFRFVRRPDQHQWLWLTALFVVLAVYTKGVQGLLLLPGLLVYAVAARCFKAVFGQRQVYVAAGAVLVGIGAYYAVRAQLQPGYLTAVWNNELFGRYAVTNEGHSESVLIYLIALRWWTVVSIFALATLLVTKSKEREVGVFAIVMAASYLLVISLSKTKLEWYLAPVFPFLSLLFVAALRTLISWLRPTAPWTRPVAIALTFGAAAWFVASMVIEIDGQTGQTPILEDRYAQQLASFRAAFPQTTSIVLGTPDFQAPALYYQRYFAERGLRIEPERLDNLDLRPGDTILTSDEEIKQRLRDDYETKRIFVSDGMEGNVILQRLTASMSPPIDG